MKAKKPTSQDVRHALELLLSEHQKWLTNFKDGHRLIVPLGADLRQALFQSTNFSGAFFTGCKFTSSVLDGSDLSDAKYNDETKLPASENAKSHTARFARLDSGKSR
jgi:uncharacterized protein YjbI with pentapeptide repeats